MDFFAKLERKYSKYAIKNLMYYIMILYGVGLVIQIMPGMGMMYWQYLSLDASAILGGQIWRVFTFLMYPPALGNFVFDSVFLGVLGLFVYYNLGQTLENLWGAFRFNVFFLMGVLGQIIATLIGYLVFQESLQMTTGFLNFSIFLAFAIYFPNAQFYMFFVLPVKAKWLAVAECAVYLYSFILGTTSTRWEIAISLANVIIFIVLTRHYKKYSPKEIKRRKDFQKGVKILPYGKTHHKCAVCGRTEKDGDHLEFRYCSKCLGDYEYCQDHLYTHQHVSGESKNPGNNH